MAWSRIDDKFHRNEKLAPLSDSAIALYVRAISWASENLTDGFIPTHALPHLAPNVALGRSYDFDGNVLTFGSLLAELEGAGGFEEAIGGHRIHDYLDFNETAAKVKSRRDAKNGHAPALAPDPAPARGHDPAPASEPARGHTGDALAPSAPVIAPAAAPTAGALPGNPEPGDEKNPEYGVAQARSPVREDDAADFFPDGWGEEPQVMPDYEAPPPNPTVAPDQPAAKPKRGNSTVQRFIDGVRARDQQVTVSPRDAAAIANSQPPIDAEELAEAWCSTQRWRPGRPSTVRFVVEDLSEYRRWKVAGCPSQWPPARNGRYSQADHV